MPRPNSRDPETDPAAFLGDELARARDAAGFKSQQALADDLGFDRSVIGKAETGERPPTPDVLVAWCKACDLDYEHFARMATLARRADGPIPRWFETWLAAEVQAAMLRYWSPVIVTPIFHTAGYARALLLAAQTDTSDEAIDALVEAKLARAAILDRVDPPEVVAIIDELGSLGGMALKDRVKSGDFESFPFEWCPLPTGKVGQAARPACLVRSLMAAW